MFEDLEDPGQESGLEARSLETEARVGAKSPEGDTTPAGNCGACKGLGG